MSKLSPFAGLTGNSEFRGMQKTLVLTLLTAVLLQFGDVYGQEAKSAFFKAVKIGEADGTTVPDNYVDVGWVAIEAPRPDGESVRSHLMRLKAEQARRHPMREGSFTSHKTMGDSLTVSDGQYLTQTLPNGFEIPIIGGIPNDNSLAISNGGILLLAFNSHIAGYDLNTVEDLYDDGRYPLGFIGIDFNGPSTNFYDPKVIYDPVRDRFILAFLRGNTPTTSGIILAFSKTNDPRDGWNTYLLPGNPLNNDRWTDFPTIAITNEELFFTANFIIPGQPWQTGFDGSMIWQLGLDEGFNGDTAIDSRLWYDIKHNGKFTRNVHAVQFGDVQDRNDLFFLSNRNFSLQNDTIFLIHINGTRNDADTDIDVRALTSSQDYGVPPFGRQSDTDTSDTGSGFDTNDGRVLGAFFVNDHIQFVSNTIDFNSGRGAVYHGMIEDPYGDDPLVSGQIIGHERLDLGYPNIAWTGVQPCERQAMIGFNHSSPNDPAGCSAIYFTDEGSYSPITYITKGESYVNRHAGNYERWGDYFGLQRKYNDPGRVWSSGYYGHNNNSNGVFSALLYSPDTLHLDIQVSAESGNALCDASVNAQGVSGQVPYTYRFNGQVSSDGIGTGFCAGDTVIVSVEDASGCERRDTVVISLKSPDLKNIVYPNPTSDITVVRFRLPRRGQVQIMLSDQFGREVQVLTRRYAGAGTYELSLDVSRLASGIYVVKTFLDQEELLTEKIMVN